MRLSLALGVVLAAASSAAVAQVPQGIDSPDIVIDGFGKTCRAGFPDFGAVAQSATAAGWIERRTFVPPNSSLPAGIVLPRTFQNGEAMLALISPSPAIPASRLGCQVTAMAKGKPDPEAFADAVAARLGLGTPEWEGKGDSATATWRVTNGTIRAEIQRYRRVRSYSLQIR